LVCALILQNFDLRLDDPNYEMQIVQTLTLKPKDFFIRASLRKGINPVLLQEQLSSSSTGAMTAPQEQNDSNGESAANGAAKDIQILFGSNTGTGQSFAQKLTARLSHQGWKPSVLDMDAAVNHIEHDSPVIIITSSYEGQPPDNAAKFVAWLQSISDKSIFKGVKYAVFGCGHSDWASTYQRIPTLVDTAFADFGGERLTERGVSDASKGDMLGDFESWVDKSLLPTILPNSPSGQQHANTAAFMEPPSVELELSSENRASHLQQNVQWGTVVAVKGLTPIGEPEKRHIEIQLPSNTTYSVGDYLAVLPTNPDLEVQRAIKRFNIPWDAVINIKDAGSTTLPVDKPIPVADLLRGYVELSQPAARKVWQLPSLRFTH
jgi:cytochrome P450/NADPH-cytochrome P450 reductase